MCVDFYFSRACSDTRVIKDDSETQSFTSAHTAASRWVNVVDFGETGGFLVHVARLFHSQANTNRL